MDYIGACCRLQELAVDYRSMLSSKIENLNNQRNTINSIDPAALRILLLLYSVQLSDFFGEPSFAQCCTLRIKEGLKSDQRLIKVVAVTLRQIQS